MTPPHSAAPAPPERSLNARHTAIPFQLGDPVAHRGVAVAPLFPTRDPAGAYVTLEEGLAMGVRVTERDGGGSVPELVVVNPTDRRVLLYDGEELAGAKQDRILDVTVLVPERTELVVPVSCVEQGRWHERSEAFSTAPHAGHAELRRRKAEALSPAPMMLGAAQRDIWEAVAEMEAKSRFRSPTRAHADQFKARAPRLSELEPRFPLQPGQCGAVVSFAGTAVCMDALSRPDAFARLYPRLLRGSLLDAIDALDGPSGAEDMERLLADAAACEPRRGPSPGLGRDVRLDGPRVVGSGLEVDGELIQLCAFRTSAPGPGRIAPPSGRARRTR